MFYFILLIISFVLIFSWAVYYVNRPHEKFVVNNIKYSLMNNKPKIFFNNQTAKFDNVTSSTSRRVIEEMAREAFSKYECPSCGSKIVEGNNIVIKFDTVLLYKDIERSFLFFTKRYSPMRPYRRIFEFDSIYAKKGDFSDIPGYIKCKTCNWNITAEQTSDKLWLKKNDLEKMISKY